MNPLANIRSSVLLFSTVLISLLLWLSASFLREAYLDRQDANFYLQYLEADAQLRHSIDALAEERSVSHWLSGLNLFGSPVATVTAPYAATDTSLETSQKLLEALLSDKVLGNRLAFQPHYIQENLGKFSGLISRLAVYRDSLLQDLKLPLERRDEGLHLFVFDFYGAMIDKLELLREGVTYLPAEQSRAVHSSMAISNATWQIELANYELSALFEGFVTSGNTASGSAHERVMELRRSMNTSWDAIKRISTYNSIDSELRLLANDLISWSSDAYLIPVRRLSLAIDGKFDPPIDNRQWRLISSELLTRTGEILKQSESIVNQHINGALRLSTRNLVIDCLLVLICALLMLASSLILKRLHDQANRDELTRLPNRRHFNSHCQEFLDGAGTGSEDSHHVMMMVDLYRFKSINDSFGQAVGDQLLRIVAGRLQAAVSDNMLVARLAGDEFSILLRDSEQEDAERIAVEILHSMAGEFHIDRQTLKLECCIGYAMYPDDGNNSEALRKAAHLALFDAKQTGPGSVVVYKAELAAAFLERQLMESDLSCAIDNNEFELHYQPQFDLQQSSVNGVEALLRWKHPTRGMVSPFLFIPVAEDAGLLPSIGKWVIEEAARQASEWQRQYGLKLGMSVNVSVHQFLHGDVVSIVKQALADNQLEPASFEIEITESVAMAELDTVLAKLEILRGLGVRIALDDFGTGYSSLSYLQDLPLDTLKIDRSFIAKLDNGTHTQRVLVESIASMAKSLQFHTVAEGVETDVQLAHVKALGIDTVQGYYYSKPVRAENIPGDVETIDATYADDASKAA